MEMRIKAKTIDKTFDDLVDLKVLLSWQRRKTKLDQDILLR